jgi:hypothetical protein
LTTKVGVELTPSLVEVPLDPRAFRAFSAAFVADALVELGLGHAHRLGDVDSGLARAQRTPAPGSCRWRRRRRSTCPCRRSGPAGSRTRATLISTPPPTSISLETKWILSGVDVFGLERRIDVPVPAAADRAADEAYSITVTFACGLPMVMSSGSAPVGPVFWHAANSSESARTIAIRPIRSIP